MAKRILILTPRYPYPVIGGDRLRIYHVCRALAQRYRLTLLSLCDSRAEMESKPPDDVFSEIHRVFLPRWRSYLNVACALPTKMPLQIAYFSSQRFRNTVRLLVGSHDAALAHLIRTGQYLVGGSAVSLLEMTDAISLNYERIRALGWKTGVKGAVYRIERKRLYDYEYRMTSQFDRVWLTSEIDRDYLGCKDNESVCVIPNGVDLEAMPFMPPSEEGNRIIFIGNLDSLQNQDACFHFIRDILPKVRERIDVTFRIVGNAPRQVMRRFERYDHVELTGRLPHVTNGIRNGFCGVCPVRAGAGIQNKVLEYLALGLPSVVSEIGIEGIAATRDKELFVYESNDEAAAQITALYSSVELRQHMARAGRSFVEASFRWKSVYEKVLASVDGLLK